MARIAILYFSGYGHTARQAEAVKQGAGSVDGAEVAVIRLNDTGELPEADWAVLDAADAIIYGSPTYMGGPAWQFKRFADASSRRWAAQTWKDKLAAGFTNSGSPSGDKASTLQYFWTLAMQHGQIWVGVGLLPNAAKANTRDDINWIGCSSGAMAASPTDASAEEAPGEGDLKTARHLGKRIAGLATRMVRPDQIS